MFFLLSFDVWKEEGKGMILIFFSLFKIKFPSNVITTIYQINCEALLDRHFN
jgi:hypothetical protein